MCDLVNLVLKCTGCNLQVDEHDIEDPDNVTGKLSDLQEEYQAQKITDYPLIGKGKNGTSFRSTLHDFFDALISSAHDSSLLYEDLVLIENIQVWVTTMSSSAIRPFRHTATVIALTIATSICGLMREILKTTADAMRQKDGEQKKKSVNKGRVAAFQSQVKEGEKRKELAESWLKDFFDTVYIHRYRDVDPKIRTDCVASLGSWISTYPDMFFAGEYLRYLGWVLSDVSAPTRGEVVKQLLKLYKNKENVGRLRAFTDRFRPRMIEMAERDADVSIRASSVDLLDRIRDAGLLQPTDIDTVGNLIFDTEPRVRKAVSGFFAENINELYESVLEEIGSEETIDEVLGEEVEGSYDSPRRAWLKFKCLAEVLRSYDSADSDEESLEPPSHDPNDSLNLGMLESRISLAAQAIYDGVPEIREWEYLAGYLLYDHSSAGTAATDDVLTQFRQRCQISEKEEVVLLELLNATIRSRLAEAIKQETDNKGKTTKSRKDASLQMQESVALHLAKVIPELLKKFQARPSTAASVLRLEQVLNLDIFQELRQESTEYASFLDDIARQFNEHSDHRVVAEASAALLHAQSFEELEEITNGKLQELWQSEIKTLKQITREDGSIHGNATLTDLSHAVHRLANLASISDCVEAFEQIEPLNKKAKAQNRKNAQELLVAVLHQTAESSGDEANPLLMDAMKAILFYYMWITQSFQGDKAATDSARVKVILDGKTHFNAAIISIVDSRHKLDRVRLGAVGTLLDLYTLFATFRDAELLQIPPSKDSLRDLFEEIPAEIQPLITETFVAAERFYAKRSKRVLEDPADDEPPEDLISEPEDSSDEEDEEQEAVRQRHRQQETMVAENRLCELTAKIVLAIVGRVIDASGPGKGSLRKRLLRNKARLGGNFKEVLGYLDEPKPRKSHKKKVTNTISTKGSAGAKSNAMVTADEDEDEIEETIERAPEEGGEDDLRERELVDDEIEDGDDDGADGREGGAVEEEEEDVMGD